MLLSGLQLKSDVCEENTLNSKGPNEWGWLVESVGGLTEEVTTTAANNIESYVSNIISQVYHLQGQYQYKEGPKKLELSSGGRAPCNRLSLLDEHSRNLSVWVYRLVVLWEAAFSFSEFFLKTLSRCLPMSSWVIYKCTYPHFTECSAFLDQKWHDLSAPPSLLTPSCPKWLFFVSPDEKVLKGKRFADVEEVKQKMAVQ